jgi:hypothetical protein
MDIVREIELRILDIRQRADLLNTPISDFVKYDGKVYVHFRDQTQHRSINGCCLGSGCSLYLPDVGLNGEVLDYAAAIWHLKDWLKKAIAEKSIGVDLEKHVDTSRELCICADLVNFQKHGGYKKKKSGSRSGLDPKLSTCHFDLSHNGIVEFYYNGKTREKEITVQYPIPMPWQIDVLSGDEIINLGNVLFVLGRAFIHWQPIIQKLQEPHS